MKRSKNGVQLKLLLKILLVICISVLATSCSASQQQLQNKSPKFDLVSVNINLNSPKPTLLPWPAAPEQAAIAANGLTPMISSVQSTPVPIASVTKIMTAYIILTDHPISTNQSGPKITFDNEDAQAYYSFINRDDSAVRVIAGEQLSELQALEALLIPSADNIADVLARWDAGSIDRFVKKMNSMARSLGMDHTFYADPSGLDPRNVSIPSDQIILATKAMAIPTFSEIVSQNHIVLPVAGWEPNYNPALGALGINGVKTGYTPQSGGCLVFSAPRVINNVQVTIVGAIFGFKGPEALKTVALQAEALLNSFSNIIQVVNSSQSAFLFKLATTSGTYLVSSPAVSGLITYPGVSYKYGLSFGNLNIIKIGKPLGMIEIINSDQVVVRTPLYAVRKIN